MAVQDRVTARNLYLYLVCLITLLIAIFATVQVVRSTVGIIWPETTSSFGWYAGAGPEAEFEGEAFAEQYLQEQDAAEDAARRSEILGAVTAGTTLLLAGGLYAYHWRRAQAERTVPAAQVAPAAGPPEG